MRKNKKGSQRGGRETSREMSEGRGPHTDADFSFAPADQSSGSGSPPIRRFEKKHVNHPAVFFFWTATDISPLVQLQPVNLRQHRTLKATAYTAFMTVAFKDFHTVSGFVASCTRSLSNHIKLQPEYEMILQKVE
jgi:hypothetical protein